MAYWLWYISYADKYQDGGVHMHRPVCWAGVLRTPSPAPVSAITIEAITIQAITTGHHCTECAAFADTGVRRALLGRCTRGMLVMAY